MEKKVSPAVQKFNDRIAALQAQKQAVLAREKSEERKKRNHRLIESGAIIEKYLGFTTKEEVLAFCEICAANAEKLEATKTRVAAIVAEKAKDAQKEEPAQ